MTELVLVRDLVLVLFTAFLGGIIFKKFRFPLMVGFLLGGIMMGWIITPFISVSDSISSIAELGVALLLFTLGLEFSLSKLRELGEVVIFGSLIQVLLCILLSVLLFPLLGLDFYSALFLGSVFSLSSTAVVLKNLSDKGELETLHGEMASGWLFMQDLYTLPLIILLPTVGKMMLGESVGLWPIFTFVKSLTIAVASFFLLIFLGKRTMPYILEKIADLKSRELLLLSSVLFCFIFAYAFQSIGLSFAIGAFVAGVVLSSSSVHHGIFAEVRPLRDLFSTVFFVSLGIMVNPLFLLSNWQIILMISVFVIVLKFVVSLLLVLLLGYHTKTATLVGFSLVSVGEFAFILAIIGVTSRLINTQVYMTILSVSFITLIISVPLLSMGERFYYQLKWFITKKIPGGNKLMDRLDFSRNASNSLLACQVVVLGHGRVGKYICKALTMAQISYVVVDYNHQLVRHLRHQGVNVIYGDPAEIDVLYFASVKNAKIAILAYADRHTQETVITNILTLNPRIKLICRTHFEEDQKKLRSLGVDIVIQPEFEAALSMTEKLLRILKTEETEIASKLKNLQSEHVLA